DLTAHRLMPITEVGIDARRAELDATVGSLSRQADVEATVPVLRSAGRHRVLDVVLVRPDDSATGLHLADARTVLKELDGDVGRGLRRYGTYRSRHQHARSDEASESHPVLLSCPDRASPSLRRARPLGLVTDGGRAELA